MNEENERVRRTDEVREVCEQMEAISEEEVWTTFRKVKWGKAVGPDNLPAEVWKCLG